MATITVLAGRVEIELTDGRVIVAPPDHFLVYDPSGQVLDSCTLYVGPASLTDEPVTRLTPEQRDWFGSGYDARKAVVDPPKTRWFAEGQAETIEFTRPGRHAGDWRHSFSTPCPVLKSGRWLKLRLPANCKINKYGIQ